MSTLRPRFPQGQSLWNGVHRSSIGLRRLALFSSDSQRHDTVGERICPAQWEN
jgi:hypothetical protein